MVKKNICGVPKGYQGFVLKRLMKKSLLHCHILPDENQLHTLEAILSVIAPEIKVITFLPWNTVPYDRASPRLSVTGARIDTLTFLSGTEQEEKSAKSKSTGTLLLTTASAIMQKVPPKSFFQKSVLSLRKGSCYSPEKLRQFLSENGYHLTGTVMEPGEYAVRGGLIDVFSGGMTHPFRIDFFGDEIDSVRLFDETTQRTLSQTESLVIKPVCEYRLTPETIALFRTRYRQMNGFEGNDFIYESVSNGQNVPGLEHFLPLLHEELQTLFDYLPHASFSMENRTQEAFLAQESFIEEYYEARQLYLKNPLMNDDKYIPVRPRWLYLTNEELQQIFDLKETYVFSPFVRPGETDAGARAGEIFTQTAKNRSVFDSCADFVRQETRRCIFTAVSKSSLLRLKGIMEAHGLMLNEAHSFKEALNQAPSVLQVPFESGFYDDRMRIITQSDVLGESQPVRQTTKRKNKIFDVSVLTVGELIVHQVHGIGRFIGLKPIEASGVAHDCIQLEYAKGDKLFVPVENMDTLSKYGSDAENMPLDTLGSNAFINRRERVRKDLFAMAEKLMQTAGLRALNKAEPLSVPQEAYQEFCLRFPYAETDDQLRTIQEIEADLSSGKPMDRLVCGDVGFGKTEMALRAAFIAAINGLQAAVIAPTTLLVRQHALTFQERFKGFPIRIDSLSRLSTSKQAKSVKESIAEGQTDIVIGTHALLSDSVHFKRLGLVIIDEEQHFGVAHKEKLKEMQKNAHILTLSATPIPRTLQLSLAGVKDLSVIATPPLDRLAVKTFVLPFDPVMIKEALLREHFRGGGVFVVTPRIADMPQVEQIIFALTPDLKIVKAHGQMSGSQLEKIMQDFQARRFDILLATGIIESGLDMSFVNTLIVYRADMFGLASLYQLRGRVGRGKIRAYAYLTLPPHHLGESAQKRLEVMQSLDKLGAGFQLASRDLDIRGAGNLLGKEQSGHIREIGVALYQKMLQEVIEQLKQKRQKGEIVSFSPQLSLGLSVLIPESYVPDFQTRLDLYHKIGTTESFDELTLLKEEITDCFGPYPETVANLFTSVELKIMCRAAYINSFQLNDKGAVIGFWQNEFPAPQKLIDYITHQAGTIRLRPDNKLVVSRPWGGQGEKIKAVKRFLGELIALTT